MIGFRSQLNAVSKMRLSFMNGTISSGYKYFNPKFIKRDIETKTLSEIKDEAYVVQLHNDLNIEADMDEEISISKYSEESWVRFKELIRPNHLYIFLHKSSLPKKKSDEITAGHVFTFYSDRTKNIVDESLITLRPGDPVDRTKLKFTFEHDKTKREYSNAVWKVEFGSSTESELKEYFFEKNPSNKQDIRFLIGINLDIAIENKEEYLRNLTLIKEELSKGNYILADGFLEKLSKDGERLTRDFVKSLNCVTAVYRGNGYEGTEVNPSTQMATWSLMLEKLGLVRRDVLIRNTKIKDPASGERIQDDTLKKIKE